MAYARLVPTFWNRLPSIHLHLDGITVNGWGIRVSKLLYNIREFALWLNIDSDQNYRMQATCTFLTGSAPCEEQAAHVRTQALISIQHQNLVEVAYRYIQSRDLGTDKLHLSAYTGTMTIVCGWGVYSEGFNIRPYAIIAPFWSLVNARNTIRYKRTENACENFLKINMDEKSFTSLQGFKYSKEGIAQLQLMFSQRGQDVKFLENKVQEWDTKKIR